MARPQKEAYELSDAEKRDLIQLIQQGKSLPEKYRFVLFEDKREIELVWNGKTREVCTTILPFQSLEHIDEPRREAPEVQSNLFDPRGRQVRGWTNKLIWGDKDLDPLEWTPWANNQEVSNGCPQGSQEGEALPRRAEAHGCSTY